MRRTRKRNEYRDMPYRSPRTRRDDEQGTFKMFSRFMRLYMQPHWKRIAVCILLVALNGCSVYIMAYYGRVVVDDILVVETPPKTPPEKTARSIVAADRTRAGRVPPAAGTLSEAGRAAAASHRPPNAGRQLLHIFVLYVLTLVILNTASRWAMKLRIRISRDIMRSLREDMHEKVLALSSRFHQSHTPGRLMARILSDVNVLQKQLMVVVVEASRNIIMCLVGIIILLVLDWRIAVLILAVIVPYAFLIRAARHKLGVISRELRHTNASLWSLGSQKLDSIRAVFAYHRERFERLNFHRLSACMLRDTLAQQRLSAGVGRSSQILSAMTTAGVFLFCASEVLEQRMSLGKMMYIYASASNMFVPILGLTQASLVFTRLFVVLHRLIQILDEPVDVVEADSAVVFPSPVKKGIKVDNISFRYSADTKDVLRDISLEVPVGRWLCIMGPSGAGKSTLLHLLDRLYDPTKGRIDVDGIPLQEVAFHSFRNRVALVPQEPQIFSGTVRDNITYGHTGATPAVIMDAAKAAECHDFIMDLPVQYETTVGEKGTTLSGGQRQRISIARALLTGPEVLLLDDCTSALDADTERRIQETLTRLLEGKTAVIVSQRVSMAVRCCRIAVLINGRLGEYGTHAALVKAGGFYSRLHAQQTG